ncbi:DUF3426 domain-containing protein [Motiliproteus sp. SC1-56]|uniref:DUF3426 domain-containing protein n=1 Tax=Motiliproteus sp. SC1-56 TaxID=2799565 RepID=UPI001A8DC869|nr:DUF3426 domain-containing protein [Motiliproteus sp. SC1-56]
MTAKHFVTQCPGCETRFQITTEQLQAADGLVRCGQCKEVFDAHDHLESAPATATAPHPTSAIPREPIQLQQRAAKPHPLRTLAWSFLCLLALTGLGAQVLWFERNQLAHHPALAPLYQQACTRLPCALQPRQQLMSISSRQLSVRDHPDYRNMLDVHLLMENQAPFAQPFPALELMFSTLDGTPQAARIFQPAEYLAGELSNQRLMPRGKPIQVQLALQDPGPQTPNYRLRFLPAE